MKLLPAFGELSAQLRDSSLREAVIAGDLCRAVSRREVQSDLTIALGMAGEPIRKVDAERGERGGRRLLVFDGDLPPFGLPLVVLVKPIDDDPRALLAVRRGGVSLVLQALRGMTLSVIDGNFPREVLASRNLTFAPYRMSSRRNKAEFYDAKKLGPAPQQQGGALHYGTVSQTDIESLLSGRRQPAGFRTGGLTPTFVRRGICG